MEEEIERFVEEAKEYLAKGQAVQASEKLYKVVEECIKALSQRYGLPEYEIAKIDGRWRSYLLGQAARRLARELKRGEIADIWARAFDIHVWGFHEGKYKAKDVEQDIPYIEQLLDFVGEACR